MDAIFTAPVQMALGAYAGALNQNFIHNLQFQICTSTTFKADIVGNLWAVYPSGKMCLELPRFCPFGILLLALVLFQVSSVLTLFICDLCKEAWTLLKSAVRFLFVGSTPLKNSHEPLTLRS